MFVHEIQVPEECCCFKVLRLAELDDIIGSRLMNAQHLNQYIVESRSGISKLRIGIPHSSDHDRVGNLSDDGSFRGSFRSAVDCCRWAYCLVSRYGLDNCMFWYLHRKCMFQKFSFSFQSFEMKVIEMQLAKIVSWVFLNFHTIGFQVLQPNEFCIILWRVEHLLRWRNRLTARNTTLRHFFSLFTLSKIKTVFNQDFQKSKPSLRTSIPDLNIKKSLIFWRFDILNARALWVELHFGHSRRSIIPTFYSPQSVAVF